MNEGVDTPGASCWLAHWALGETDVTLWVLNAVINQLFDLTRDTWTLILPVNFTPSSHLDHLTQLQVLKADGTVLQWLLSVQPGTAQSNPLFSIAAHLFNVANMMLIFLG